MELNRIQVKGFKSIKELDLELKALNILIGANGSGKSNFISLFKLLNQIVGQNLQSFVGLSGGAETFLFFGSKVTDNIEIKLNFGWNGYNCILKPTVDDKLIFDREECLFHNPNYPKPYSELIGTGSEETNLHKAAKNEPGKVADYVLRHMQSWLVYHFHDTSDSAQVKKTSDISDNRYFKPDASNLSAFLYFLQKKYPGHYKNIVDTIIMVAPFFKDFILRPTALNPDKIKLEWKHKGSDAYFNAYSMSDGTLRFICLVTLLLQPQLPSVILLDEPELGLHPYAINVLADLLISAATKTQVIVSTQSVTLVNHFSHEDIVILDHKENASEFRRPSDKEIGSWMDDYGLGDLWEKNILGGRPS